MRSLSPLFLFNTLLLGSAALLTPAPGLADPAPKESPASLTLGSVRINGRTICYHAIAGTIAVHGPLYNDADKALKSRGDLETSAHNRDDKTKKTDDPAVASMFYTAYFRNSPAPSDKRPLIFFYNGGPGSSSLWLHLGSFAPVRVSTPGDAHLPPPPYHLEPNGQSLLDAADLVFIDAPATGFSRIGGKDAAKTFLGVDGDAHAFAEFIETFLRKYQRYNSPRYLFGESYGTLRSAIVANELQEKAGLDLNGIILLSQILSYDNDIDSPELNPGNELPYALALPTYAATAWYHQSLPDERPKDRSAFLREVETFAMKTLLPALEEGNALDESAKERLAEQIHAYTGLPTSYLLRANLRVSGEMFEHELQLPRGKTTGRLDTAYSGPSLDPMGKNAAYDPQSSAVSSAYVSTFNDYVRSTLHYGQELPYRIFTPTDLDHWNWQHKSPPASAGDLPGAPNAMPDLAFALKTNPNLKVMLNSGIYDLATPYYAGIYEINHLQIPESLTGNIEIHQYPAGHMVYVHEENLSALRKNIVTFLEKTRTKS